MIVVFTLLISYMQFSNIIFLRISKYHFDWLLRACSHKVNRCDAYWAKPLTESFEERWGSSWFFYQLYELVTDFVLLLLWAKPLTESFEERWGSSWFFYQLYELVTDLAWFGRSLWPNLSKKDEVQCYFAFSCWPIGQLNHGGLGRTRTSDLTLIRRAL